MKITVNMKIIFCLILLFGTVFLNADNNNAMPVKIEKAKKHILINSINVFGAIKSDSSANINVSTLFDGIITNKYYTIGDIVKKNALLAVIKTKKAKMLSNIGGYHIKDIKILAPISGYVVKDSISIGSIITPGMPIAHIVSNKNKYILITIPNKYAKQIKIGLKAIIKCNKNKYHTKIIKIIPISDPLNNTFKAIGKVKSKDLYIGNICETTIILNKKNVLALKRNAVLSKGDKKIVFIIKGDIASETVVKIGIKTDKYIEIISGVAQGDDVAILGNYELSDKMRIRVIK